MRLPKNAGEKLREMTTASIAKLVAGRSAMATEHAKKVWKQFMGGMCEGQSYGLRRWYSSHCSGIEIAAALEDILADPTKVPDAEWPKIRSIASRTQNIIAQQIPKWAQARVSAHPHLPFFGRISPALVNLSKVSHQF